MPSTKRVLFVEVRSEAEYCGAFIGTVKGESYREEALEVAVNGSPASTLFSEVYFEPFNRRHRPLLREPFSPKLPMPSWPEYVERLPPGIIETHQIDEHVLFVAAETPVETWGACVGAVEGKDVFAEAPGVVATGSEIPFDLARVVFRDLGRGTRSGEFKWHHYLENEPELGQRHH